MTIRPEDVQPEDERSVHEKLDAKIESLGKARGLLGKLVGDARTLYALLRDPEFKMEWHDKAKIIACLLYFIMPADAIPDFIVGVGFIDDAVVVGLALRSLSSLVERYRAFRAANPRVERVVKAIEGKPAAGAGEPATP